jgi:protein MpaA
MGLLALLALPYHAIPASSASPTPANAIPTTIDELCRDLKSASVQLKWKIDPCSAGIAWKTGGTSVEGRPLMLAEFGDPSSGNTTLIFSTVHGDEITPLYVGYELVRWLHERKDKLGKAHVVVAPLVNPDGFFRKPKRTRVNARGVDLNRNFATNDWPKDALAAWKKKFRSDPRRFPGSTPSSEPETLFQEELIRKYKPSKILSIHSPLNFMDYDGPSHLALANFPREYVQECLKLRKRLKAISSGYFPGSLGNFSGHELGIPTLTLELPTANPRKAEEYWKKFNTGIQTMIDFVVPPPPVVINKTRQIQG